MGVFKNGLFYQSENGTLFPITIKLYFTDEGKTNAVFSLGDFSNQPSKEVIDEFTKFLACMQKPMGADNCFPAFTGDSCEG